MLIDLNELGKKLNAYKTLVKSQEGQISVLRDDALIATYEAEVIKFLAEVEDTILKLTEWQLAA
jgi:hypothetical protein